MPVLTANVVVCNFPGSKLRKRKVSYRHVMNRNGSNSSAASDEYLSRAVYASRDSERFFGEFEDVESEAEEQPGELIPLGLGRSPRGQRPRHNSNNSTSFHDFYKLMNDHLGSGAYGSVATCVSKSTGQEFAVKVISKEDETHTRSRILREVNTLKLCKKQPNIVQLIEWFEDDKAFYMVFEKMRGGPLLQHILRKGYFTEEEARMVTKDIASALKFLHDQGIAHRDVKPENILCTNPHRVSPVKLCDLDLASRPIRVKDSPPRMTQVSSEPNLASPVGSAEFMAPEVVDTFVGDRLKYDKRCDMWSLGVILYIMLCGYAPFQGECDDDECGWMDGQPCEECQSSLFARIQRGEYDFPSDEWGMISDEVKDLVTHLLVKDVKKRYTAEEVLRHPWLQQNAPMTSLQTPNNLSRNDSARDVQLMTEHFNVMNRLGCRLSSRHQLSSTSEEEVRNNIELDQTKFIFGSPAPVSSLPVSSLPLFMIPPDALWDAATDEMIYPSPMYSPNSNKDDLASAAANINFPITFDCQKLAGSRGSLPRFVCGSMSKVKELESCQTAMARQDSKADLHQISRETEVNV